MPVSEILNAAGVDFAGTIPVEIQLVQVFAAAMLAGSKEPDAARGLIEFLASEQASAVIQEERDGTARETRKELMGPGRLTRRLSRR
jgi:ABC-type Fe3+ transport system substrate-binding protein